ncbi:MAG: aldo/keto reductase [Paludibacteraceae bacterium]|nr:aldo/keto reductase [Paludibacteraceae bacterium]
MSDNNKNTNRMNRRAFLKMLGGGTLLASASLVGCDSNNKREQSGSLKNVVPAGGMTYRVSPTSGDKVSILGYGCMRLPTVKNGSARDTDDEIDQEQVNAQVDYALAHGVNYFDTSPVYCKGRSEHAMGIALRRHPRNSYFIATKLSNFSSAYWPEKDSKEMYYNSLKELQTDYIDYMLLHAIGQSGTTQDGKQLNGMEALQARYFDNGILDFLVEERKAGRIRNLGFSYHGDIKVFDYLLSMHDKYKWDFVQIQLNYVDWHYAKEVNPNNTNAEYLYAELEKRNIPAIIMEPLLGGRLAKLPDYLSARLKQRDPESSVASWAFRYAGTFPKVLTVLSGMTYMEHLQDNLRTYSPLVSLSEEELSFLHDETARLMIEYPLVPCTKCQYCMPCEFGIDIPSIFTHYNKCVTENYVVKDSQDENYRKARQVFLVGYDRSVPKLRQADHCIGCGLCQNACPQGIKIPEELHRIGEYVEKLKRGLL